MSFPSIVFWFDAARKRFVESKLQSLDPHSFSVDLYLKALEGAKEKKDVQKRYSCGLKLHDAAILRF